MTTILIFLCLLFTTLLSLFGYIKISIAALVITLVGFFLIGSGLLPAMLARCLQKPLLASKFSLDGPTAIVLLGAGTVHVPEQNTTLPLIKAYPSIYEAARLYADCQHSGNQCTIIISGGDVLRTGQSEAAVYRHMLTQLNVNAADILLEPNSMNTFQNAQFTSQLLKQHAFKQVLLVTASTHMRRAMLCFSHFGIQATPVPAGYASTSFSLLPKGKNIALMDKVMHEYIGILQHTIYDKLGWNK